MNKYHAQRTDKLFLFYRNKALYANVTLQWFWDVRQHFGLPNYVYKVLLEI